MMNGNTGNWSVPFVGDWSDSQNLKSMHEHYDVYVNGDFIGEKVLVTPSEGIDDVSAYLRRCHFDDFTTDLDGDHYHIYADEPDVAESIKGQLQAYLRTR